MAWEEDAEEHEFRQPLPPEDRLWRHPSEWNAEQSNDLGTSPVVEPAAPHPSPPDSILPETEIVVLDTETVTPWRSRTLVIASLSALGAAMLVSGLFIALDSTDAQPALGQPPIETFSRNPVIPRTVQVDPGDWARVVSQDTAPAVAAVQVTTASGIVTGSGVVIRGDGYLLTSYDLVADAHQVSVRIPGADHIHEATVVGIDSISGVAVLGVAHADFSTALLGFEIPTPQIGAPVVAVGADAAIGDLQMGVVTGTRTRYPVAEDQNLHGLLVSSEPMPSSGSGGAMVDQNGVVVGIVVDVGAQNSTYAVPIAYARQVAEDIMYYREARHPWLAVRGLDIGLDEAQQLHVEGGVRITDLIEGGPAQTAGLRVDDVVVNIGAGTVWAMSDLVLELRQHAPGEQVDITIIRDGKTVTIALDLGLRPTN